jgi:1,3-beta-glucan synthase component
MLNVLSLLFYLLTIFFNLLLSFFHFHKLEIATKAYYFDAALTFGKSAYIATGRDFVIRHVSFVENYRALALSHIYTGAEGALLLALSLSFGTYSSTNSYAFLTVPAWFFTFSLLLGALLFNPFALDSRSILNDLKEWKQWLTNVTSGNATNDATSSWIGWFNQEIYMQYRYSSKLARSWRFIRVSRLLLLVALMLTRLPGTNVDTSPLLLAVFIGLAMGTLILMQVCIFLKIIDKNAKQNKNIFIKSIYSYNNR